MAFAATTLGITLALVSMILSLLIGSISGRDARRLIPVFIFAWIVIPLSLSFLFYNLGDLIVLYDWPEGSLSFGPETAIFAGSIVGGLLGIKAGTIWSEDRDRSCLQCTLLPIVLLLVVSLIVLFFL